MNQFAFRIYKKTINNPVIGGTVTAKDYNEAVKRVVSLNKITVKKEVVGLHVYRSFILKDSEVGILIYIRPEDF